MLEIKAFFFKKCYCHAKAVFNKEEIVQLEQEFDRIVAQLYASGEKIDATWMGPEADRVKGKDDSIIHTHNVQNVQKYTSIWLKGLCLNNHDYLLK